MTNQVADIPAARDGARAPGRLRGLTQKPGFRTFLLVGPGTLWQLVLVGASLVSVVLFSFWSSGFAGLHADYTLENYKDIITDGTFWHVTRWTLEVMVIVLAGVTLIAYPTAYFLWRVVKSNTVRTVLLLLTIIPFWTSYLTRTITWIPMFGRNGAINKGLQGLGIIDHPLDILLYSSEAMVFALWFLFIVFMIGPIYFSMSRIDDDIISAAAVHGAKPWRTFVHVILPLTKAGLMAGALFVVVLTMAEFFTERAIGGARNPMLAGLILRQVDIFNFAAASAVSVVLILLTLVLVGVMLRFVDIRKI
jgi:putative spermidine/putrescine transport system permease protein